MRLQGRCRGTGTRSEKPAYGVDTGSDIIHAFSSPLLTSLRQRSGAPSPSSLPSGFFSLP